MKTLRIFYAAQPGCAGIPGSQLWHANLYMPLVDLGHEVVPFDYDLMPHFQHLDPANPESRRFIEENRPKLEAELLRQVRAEHRRQPLDVFFSYFYSACASPETIRAIRKMGICAVNWYCNASYQFHLVGAIAPAYDYCLVPEAYRLNDYRRAGANPIYCQEAANPNIYKPHDVPTEFDVTFVGQAYGDRPACIRHLLNQGLDVRVWGPGWQNGNPRFAGPLSDGELVRMFSRSRINLGFSKCGQTHLTDEPIRQVRLRDFEVPMSGGFYMIEYMPELDDFFEIDREIVCYTDSQDLADKARYFLEHDDEREAIRRAGYERCRRDHTWQKRFETAFHKMGLC